MSTPAPSLDHIPAFHAVMTLGSLSAAARALRLAQPTVRRHIEDLEDELGTQLFTRAANGLTPTDMAQTLLPMAVAVLEEAAALGRMASAERDSLEGVVRLTCSRVAATHVVPPLMAEIMTQAPGLRLEVAATDLAENLTRRAADIAVRFTPPKQQALVAARLPDVEVGFFSASGLALDPATTDIADLPLIVDDRENLILPALVAAGLPAPNRIVLRCDDPLAQIAHVVAGLGVGLVQAKLAARLGLVRVLPRFGHAMPAWLVVHEDQSKVARIRFVFDHLKRRLPMMM